ncbi:MAG: hypothetical protein AB1779_05155 [Candidatus Thermoplasmatota archaeon]
MEKKDRASELIKEYISQKTSIPKKENKIQEEKSIASINLSGYKIVKDGATTVTIIPSVPKESIPVIKEEEIEEFEVVEEIKPTEKPKENCPSCSARITEKNKMIICSSCKKKFCNFCERYEQGHLTTNIYYDYVFDFPLCKQCYEMAFSIQKEIARAITCLGNGNYTYAFYYASNAKKAAEKTIYEKKVNELIDKIQKAKDESKKYDEMWKTQRKIGFGKTQQK